jgi:hypothetical protein
MQELMINENNIKDKIHNIRNQQVMIDRDLALLYGVETKVFNQAVKRNKIKGTGTFFIKKTNSQNSNSSLLFLRYFF